LHVFNTVALSLVVYTQVATGNVLFEEVFVFMVIKSHDPLDSYTV